MSTKSSVSTSISTPVYSTFYVPHEPVYAPHSDEMMTKQEFKDECDINNIIKQFQMTGIVSHIQSQEPLFADLPDYMDYQQALYVSERAEEAFAALPSKVRDHFHNSPELFLGAFSDENQKDKLIELGLLTSPEAPSRTPQEPSGGPQAPQEPVKPAPTSPASPG